MKSRDKVILIMLFILLLILNFQPQSFTQNTYDRQLKYWYLRERLRYFIARGDNPLTEVGTYLPITIRNRNEDNVQHDYFEDFADYGQESSLFGKYIGVLATEYYLLTYYGRNSEALKTEQELMNALVAQKRRDLCEHFYGYSDIYDGFFVRHDTPQDLNNMYDDFLNIYPELTHYAGLLIQKDPLLDGNGNLRPISAQGDQTAFPPDYHDAMSQDEVIFTLEGLALAFHFGPPAARSYAQDLALNILHECFANGGWQISDPNYNTYTGSDCSWLSQGFSSVEDYFGGPYLLPTYYSTAYWYSDCYMGWGGSSNICHMVAGLAAIGDGWGSGNATQSGIYNNCDGENNWEEYYLWLNKALWDYHHDYISVGNVEDRLDEAPCEGPWRRSKQVCANNGWASSDRWYHQINDQTGSDGFVGISPGIDYMILLNLYYICNVTGCSVCSPFQNFDQSILANQWPTGNEGSILQPFNFSAFRSINSTDQISDNPLQGDVNYTAGEEIFLNPGFYAETGVIFTATISPINYCPNGPYKKDSASNKDLKENSIRSSGAYNNSHPDTLSKISPNSSSQWNINYSIYPNPTDGILFIKSNNNSSIEFTVQNVEGIIIVDKFLNSENTHKIDISSLIPGIYIVKLISQSSTVTKKIIKN